MNFSWTALSPRRPPAASGAGTTCRRCCAPSTRLLCTRRRFSVWRLSRSEGWKFVWTCRRLSSSRCRPSRLRWPWTCDCCRAWRKSGWRCRTTLYRHSDCEALWSTCRLRLRAVATLPSRKFLLSLDSAPRRKVLGRVWGDKLRLELESGSVDFSQQSAGSARGCGSRIECSYGRLGRSKGIHRSWMLNDLN